MQSKKTYIDSESNKKTKNYYYKTMNAKSRITKQIHVKYEQYKDMKKKITRIRKLMKQDLNNSNYENTLFLD
jgi:hypothetical protein